MERKNFFSALNSSLLGGTASTFALKVTWIIFSFLTGIILARMLGIKEFGIYTYVLAWVYLLVPPAMFGFDSLLIREVAIYHGKSAWGELRGLLKRTTEVVLAASVVIILIAISIGMVWGNNFEALTNAPFFASLFIVPVLALARLRQSAMQGLHRVVSAQLPEMVVQPLLFIILLLVFYFFISKEINALTAIVLNIATIFMVFLIGSKMLKKALPAEMKTAVPCFDTRQWIACSVPMLIISCAMIANSQVGIIMLGSMAGAENAGIYSVSTKGAEMISFILYSANAVLGPSVAGFYNSGDMKQLKKIITKGAKIIFFLSLPAGLCLMIFGNWFLQLFGNDFLLGLTPLWILCIGQIISSVMGPAGVILVMTGHERVAARCIIVSGCINIFFSAILIPSLAMKGAALAASASGFITSLLMTWMVFKKLKIYSPAFGINLINGQT